MVSTRSSRAMQWLGLILLAAILLQTIAVAVSFMYFNNVLTTMKDAFSKSSISCVMRANLGAIEGTYTSAKGEKDDPCWQATQQLNFLIDKVMSKRYEQEIPLAVKDEVMRVLPSLTTESQDSAPHPEISAHVTGTILAKADVTNAQYSKKVLGQKIGAWEWKKGQAFLHNVELSDGELIVPRAGLYYVYSQTYFRYSQHQEDEGEGAQEDPARARPMLQYIYKKVASYPIPILLMKNAQSTCWSRDAEYGLYSIYQAGTVQLGAGDRIFVSVSNVSAVDMDQESSFFGTILLG